ncbi:MAG: hypothetical protein RLZZ306_1446 [Bacteroidota bacterium]|jgi:hypothetical protein
MVDLVKAKHLLSLKYDIAASDLDESVVPLMIGINKISEDLEKSSISYELQVKNIEKLMSQKTPQIYCDKPKTAVLVGIGKYGSISLAISILLSVFWIGLVALKTNEMKYAHLEKLSKIVKYDSKSNTYFIGQEDFRWYKTGIILTKKK